MVNTLTTAIVATNLYGVYNSTETPTLMGLSGSILSESQASEHIAQYDAKPEYLRLEIPQLEQVMAQIERDDTTGFSFTVSSTGKVRLFESEPERLTQVDSYKIHRTETVEQALRKAILKYSKLGDYIAVDFHRDNCYIMVGKSGSTVVGL